MFLCRCIFYSLICLLFIYFFFFKKKTEYEMLISDWSSDVCSSDLRNKKIWNIKENREHKMNRVISSLAISLGAGLALAIAAGGAIAAETPQKGGILKYVVPDEPPSFDGHRETTFALIHPIAPFYSLLIRANPQNPQDPNDFVCDL